MILIVTNKQDPHTDEVVRRLTSKQAPVFRLNTEDFTTKYRSHLFIDSNGRWGGEIADELGRVIDLSRLRSGWIRRPEFAFAWASDADDGVQKFAVAETKAFVESLYSMKSVKWINETFSTDRSKHKFPQLILASEMGVRVPKTIITNDPRRAETFFSESDSEILTKVVYTGNAVLDGINHSIVSKKVSREQFEKLKETIRITPTQFQEYIEKAYEVRVTTIGEKVFAVKIDSQLNEETKVDWRPRTSLNPHSEIELPKNIEDFCRKFLKSQNLIYGAMDFIVGPDGGYCFLENNPSGQYLWLEHATGVPITAALCETLVANM